MNKRLKTAYPTLARLTELFEVREVADEYSPRNLHLFWKVRSRDEFARDRNWKTWNKRFLGVRAGSILRVHGKFYRQAYVGSFGLIYEHAIIYSLTHSIEPESMRGLTIDHHPDPNGLNNSESNIRLVTNQKNNQNQTGLCSSNTSGLRGISWKKGLQKWRVRLCVDGRDKYIGLFNTQFEAARAYAAAAEHYHGEEYNHGNREWLIKNGARRVAQRRLFRAGNGEWIVANHRWLKDSAQ